MAAMHRTTGKAIQGVEEIEQSVLEILGTVSGDRIMRADYGSGIFELVDNAGMDASGKMRLAQAGAEALSRFEKRIQVKSAAFEASADGTITQTIYATVRSTSERIVVTR